MKARPEFRKIFSSPSLFYRILHILSTQRYRLPVRRYILDLFDVPLDRHVIRTLIEVENSLFESTNVTASPRTTKTRPRISVFASSTMSESDEDEDAKDADVPAVPTAKRPISLLPVKRVIGFDAPDSGSDSD